MLFDVVLALQLVHESEGARADDQCLGHVTPADVVVGFNGVASVLRVRHDYRRSKLPAQPRRGYFAPELLLRKYPASRKTDSFSLGVMLWEALTDQRLFPQDNAQTLFERIRSHELPEPGALPAEAWALLMIAEKAFTYHPKNRYANAGELLGDMDQSAGRLVGTHAQVGEWVRAAWQVETEYVHVAASTGRGALTEPSPDCSGEIHAQPVHLPPPPALPTLTEIARGSCPEPPLSTQEVPTVRIARKVYVGATGLSDEDRDLPTRPVPPAEEEFLLLQAEAIHRVSELPTAIQPAQARALLQRKSAPRSELSTIHEHRVTPAPPHADEHQADAGTGASWDTPQQSRTPSSNAPRDSELDAGRPALHDLPPAPSPHSETGVPPARSNWGVTLVGIATTLGLGWALFSLL
ncbi:MAG: hypothetical protein RJA70_4032 [Pseudomonadota bacterium]